MEFTSAAAIKDLLLRHDAKPSKGLGQNFLIDNRVLEKIIAAADIQPEDTILEIGPGIGTLTVELAKKAKQVIAVEKDSVMVNILAETLAAYQNVKITNGDILTFDLKNQSITKVVANIPYYLTAPLIRKLLEEGSQLREIILMVQKEVAHRICAKVPDMNLLAVSVQFYATPSIVGPAPKHCFWPAPNVDSAIIKIIPKKNAEDVEPIKFFNIVKAGFSQPRKQLVNNFSTALKLKKENVTEWLTKNNIKPNQRAETLSIANWIELTKTFK